ncbi:MAG: hypothetical protein GY859_15010, partial [Desulfobacterales bacterium]|nr:hypothetical protein [Desulfobacterales bacterium]
DFRGRLSGWTEEARVEESWRNASGMQYLPRLSMVQPVDDESFFDLEISLNCYFANTLADADADGDVKLHRAKLRYATTQTETRLGLQKINFGPSRLLRPLRWFDKLNPADPLQFTEGVYGLRFKYNALDNSSLWLWLLLGNDDPKGAEVLPTVKNVPEFGGRLQHPVFDGEMAVTFHAREVDGSPLDAPDFNESRLALDGFWDVGVGVWFESVLQRAETDALEYRWTKRIAGGVDYTFALGNGLHTLFEHMAVALSDNPPGWDEDTEVSAFSLNYPLGLFDTVTAMGYYSWDFKKYHQYLTWERSYDDWRFICTLFYHPANYPTAAGLNQTGADQGKGCQLMIVFNH